jgi:putative Mg2+ transporter-C (MgtC) family protein
MAIVSYFCKRSILRQPNIGTGKDKIYGLTSAAAIWVSSALGVTVGVGLYPLSILGAILSLIVLKVIKKLERTED